MNQNTTMSEERIERPGGIRIFVRSWHPSSPHGVVVICHGFNSNSGQYRWAAEQFAASGLAVYALDLRGRGQSDGARFYVENISEYVGDVDAVVKMARSREPGLPVFLLGHSAGGVVACSYALDHQSQINGLICESFAYQVPAPDFALNAISALSRVAPKLGILKLKNRDFTRDKKAVEVMDADPFTANEVQPARTVSALWKADQRLKKEFSRITVPVFILHGTADRAAKASGSAYFYEAAGSKDKTLKLYEGHYHDLLKDLGKEAVMSDIKGWIDKHAFGMS